MLETAVQRPGAAGKAASSMSPTSDTPHRPARTPRSPRPRPTAGGSRPGTPDLTRRRPNTTTSATSPTTGSASPACCTVVGARRQPPRGTFRSRRLGAGRLRHFPVAASITTKQEPMTAAQTGPHRPQPSRSGRTKIKKSSPRTHGQYKRDEEPHLSRVDEGGGRDRTRRPTRRGPELQFHLDLTKVQKRRTGSRPPPRRTDRSSTECGDAGDVAEVLRNNQRSNSDPGDRMASEQRHRRCGAPRKRGATLASRAGLRIAGRPRPVCHESGSTGSSGSGHAESRPGVGGAPPRTEGHRRCAMRHRNLLCVGPAESRGGGRREQPHPRGDGPR